MLTLAEQKKFKKIISTDSERIVEVFETLGDANRCQLFRLIAAGAGANVTDASRTIGISLSLTSQHFKILAAKNLIKRHKQGREVIYSLNKDDAVVKAILAAIS